MRQRRGGPIINVGFGGAKGRRIAEILARGGHAGPYGRAANWGDEDVTLGTNADRDDPDHSEDGAKWEDDD